ncbi:sugar porter family MFS transporter [Candidatus Cetobacterium colombiensis]|uniref:Sugar porter family MFS transporter n=1 Tax=Candidatus Cetobacterium colombiensis TaxID=3073100 RepID=A0ABU4WAB5_9FUSO|nr:sugar porter family MFS transporter [Candidatus Cetobacterium colombiensis]MDX8335350.1 sugar porter family MFS transporter [Candidatus Cetobacterium colombiensis]
MKSKNIYSVAAIIGMAGFIFVYDSANLGGSVKYIQPYFNLLPNQVGILIAISLIGNFFGSLLSGYFSDKIGRKMTMIYGIVIGASGLALAALSTNILFFCIGRIIFGFSTGLIFVAAPMYITEVAPASKRGRAGSIRQLLLAFGLILGYTTTFLFNYLFSIEWNIKFGWRILISIEILLLGIMFLAMLTLVESPRWLIIKGRIEEAKKSLECFIESEDRVDLVFSEMLLNNSKEILGKKVPIRGGLIYALSLCIIFPIFRQLSGVNAITYYAQKIFSEISNTSTNLAYFQSIFIGFSELLGAIFVVSFADKFGRKILLLLGAAGMFFSEGFIAYSLYYSKVSLDLSYLVYIYNFFFTISAGAMLTVYISEALPTVIRSKGSALTGMINWIADAAIIYSFPLLNANVYLTEKFHGSISFIIFSISMLLFFIVILFLPETKNKTLEEIANYWKTKGNWE